MIHLNVFSFIYEFVLTYLLFYIIHQVFLNKKRKKYNPNKKNNEINFLIERYKLDLKKIGYKNLLRTVTLTNCFILTITVMVFSRIEKFFLSALVTFVIAVALIYSLYEIIGRYYKKKGGM